MAKRIVFLRTWEASSLLGSRHSFWCDSMLSHAMQIGVTSSARFASSAPRENRSRAALPWQLSHATCNSATQLQVTPWNLAWSKGLLFEILVWKGFFYKILVLKGLNKIKITSFGPFKKTTSFGGVGSSPLHKTAVPFDLYPTLAGCPWAVDTPLIPPFIF